MGNVRVVPVAIQGCLETFQRCETVVDAVSVELLRNDVISGSSIGGHLRHSLDHAICFLRGLPEGIIEYDARDRDEGIEREPAEFHAALNEVKSGLEALTREDLPKPVQVRVTASLDTEPLLLDSTVERELAFLSSHTIHHLALVHFFCVQEGIALPEDMALAFSTAAYRKASTG